MYPNDATPGSRLYVYACLKPAPEDPECAPFIEYIVDIKEDTDGDGTCDEDDCQPNDANFPATPGTSCNDGTTTTY